MRSDIRTLAVACVLVRVCSGICCTGPGIVQDVCELVNTNTTCGFLAVCEVMDLNDCDDAQAPSPVSLQLVFLLVSLLVGVPCAFGGYRLAKISVALGAFVAGLVVCSSVLPMECEQVMKDGICSMGVLTALCVLLSLACGVLAFYLFEVGVFILGFLAGAAGAVSFYVLHGDWQFGQMASVPPGLLFTAVAFGAISGVLGVCWTKCLLVFSTALIGAGLIAVGIHIGFETLPSISILMFVVVFFVGALVQYKLDSRRVNPGLAVPLNQRIVFPTGQPRFEDLS